MTPNRLAYSCIAALALAGSALLSSPVAAQERGTVELGVLGRYTAMDKDLEVEDILAGGGRIGLFFARNWALEAELTYGVGDIENPSSALEDKYSDPLWNYRIAYNAPFGTRNAFIIGAGYAYDAFGYARTKPLRSGGPSGLLGIRFGLNNNWSLRAEAHGHYAVKVDADEETLRPDQDSYMNIGGQLGLSYQFNPFRRRTVTVTDTVQITRTQVDTVYRERIAPPTQAGPTTGPRTPVVIGLVNFVFAQADLTTDAQRILGDIATSLARPENAGIRIEVKGHTDAIGGEQANLQLAERRAESVAAFLAQNGVDRGRITTAAAGKGEPVAENRTPEGRATNRRVVISIVN
jgi:OOP family OmpA-OmpF porin